MCPAQPVLVMPILEVRPLSTRMQKKADPHSAISGFRHSALPDAERPLGLVSTKENLVREWPVKSHSLMALVCHC